jgi:uncharacterized protein (DUF2235 family)
MSNEASWGPKNVVLFCDARVEPYGKDTRTNLVSIYQNLVRDEQQVAIYKTADVTWPWLAELFGFGFSRLLKGLYRCLIAEFRPGDRLFVFGFARGALLVNALTHMLSKGGLLTTDDRSLVEKAYQIYAGKVGVAEAVDFKRLFAAECTPHFVGLLDLLQYDSQFVRRSTDGSLPPDVFFGYHAIALDDRNSRFPCGLWDERRKPPDQIIEQMWFPGGSGDLGGIHPEKGLSDSPLKWLLQKAQSAGLRLRPGWDREVRPDPAGGLLHDSRQGLWLLFPPRARRVPEDGLIHESVQMRITARVDYRPVNLPEHAVFVSRETGSDLEDLRSQRDLETYRERIKELPEETDLQEEIDLWEKMAAILQKLGREREHLDARNTVERLRATAAFETNAGSEIRLASLELEDLDFFGTFQWRFSPRMNVLLGKNGYGKSHLYALIVALLQNEEKRAGDFIDRRSRQGARAALQLERDGEPHKMRYTKVGFEENSIGKVPLLAISELRFIDKSRDDFGKEDVDEKDNLKVHGAWHFLNSHPLGPIIQDFIYKLCQEYSEKSTLDLPIVKLYYDVVYRLTST